MTYTIILKFGDGELKKNIYDTVYSHMYLALDRFKDTEWHYVEISADRLIHALNNIKAYAKKRNLKIATKVDKSKADKNIGRVYFRRKE